MKDKTKNERYAEKWFRENGFEFVLLKQYNSKTVWSVIKQGVCDKFELPNGVEDIKNYMKMYEKTFEMLAKIEKHTTEKQPQRRDQNIYN